MAGALTVLFAVALSLPGLASVVADVTVAVLVSTVPPVTAAPTLTTSVNTALPIGIDANEHDTVPPAPTTGVVHDQLTGEAMETKFVPAGNGSEIDALAALLGPTLAALMV